MAYIDLTRQLCRIAKVLIYSAERDPEIQRFNLTALSPEAQPRIGFLTAYSAQDLEMKPQLVYEDKIHCEYLEGVVARIRKREQYHEFDRLVTQIRQEYRRFQYVFWVTSRRRQDEVACALMMKMNEDGRVAWARHHAILIDLGLDPHRIAQIHDEIFLASAGIRSWDSPISAAQIPNRLA